MHLEIKQHTVPHLKGLNSDIEPQTRRGRGSNFIGPMLSYKVLILLHTESSVPFVMLSAVYL